MGRGKQGAKIFLGTLPDVIFDCAKFQEIYLTGFPKKFVQIQKNQNFTDKFFLNTIPRPKFVTNDNNSLLDNKYGCNWCPHQILAKLVNIWPNYEYPKSRKPSKKKRKKCASSLGFGPR